MMGSDLGSSATKDGVRRFKAAHPDCELILVGRKEELSDLSDCEIIDAPDVVKMEMGALEVLRAKNSSLVKAVSAVVEQKADGVVSAGSTGAFLSAATLIIKKIPGVERPALVTAFPNVNGEGYATVLDVGASSSNTTFELDQFAFMFREDAVIKRLIGLPGESLYFTPEGELYVKKVGASDYALVEQPSAIVNDVDEYGNRIIPNTASVTAIKNIGLSVFVGSETNPATMEAEGAYEKLPKKEVALLKKEQAKLARNLEGIKEMRRLPQAVVVVDPTVEHNAVKEAHKLGIKVFGICDTSDDPDPINFPLPSNNDAASAIKLLMGTMADAVVESKGGVTEFAFVKDQGEEATMKDAIRVADAANEVRKAAMRAQRKEREERFAKMQADRASRYASHGGTSLSG